MAIGIFKIVKVLKHVFLKRNNLRFKEALKQIEIFWYK